MDHIEDSEQLKRYRGTFPNLILTNFLEFRHYRDGQPVETVELARSGVLADYRMTPPVRKADELTAMLDRFLGFSLPQVFTAEMLAVELAKRTRFLRDVISRQLHEEESRRSAFDNIPHTIGVLRDLFRFISFGALRGRPPQNGLLPG